MAKDVYFNSFTITLPDQAVEDIARPGQQADDAVVHWQPRIDLTGIDDADLRSELAEYGAWDDAQLADRHENEQRILWVAACNIREDALDAE